jgi:hypothetical protein
MFTVKMMDDEEGQVQVVGETDKKGNAIPFAGGPPVFASADPAVCTFDTDPSDATGNTAKIVATGPLASAAIVTITVGSIVENGAVEIVADPDAPAGLTVNVGTMSKQP